MSRINNFYISCKLCSDKSKMMDGACNIGWLPDQSLEFVCYKCGTVEHLFINPKHTTPKNIKDFEQQIDDDGEDIDKRN